MTHQIKVPRLNANDDSVEVARWLVEDGAPVTVGQDLVDVTTSKATTTLHADARGFVRHLARPGDDVRVGAALAEVSATRPASTALPAGAQTTPERSSTAGWAPVI